jgi:hypothetical protein
MKALASYIMRGPLQAVMFVSVTAILSLIVPLVNYLSGAAMALVTLRRGTNAGLLVLVSAIAICGLFALFVSKVPDLPIAVIGVAVLLILVWGLAVVLRHTRSLSNTLLIAVALGIAFVLIVYAATDPVSLWQNAITDFFSPVLDKADEQSKAVLLKQIAESSRYMTGLFAAAIVLNCAVCLFMGRWWQALLYNPGGFQQEFHSLKFAQTFAIATAIIGFVSYVMDQTSALAADLFSVTLVVYYLQGLAVAHSIVRMKKMNIGWLVALYVLSLPLLKIIAVVGFIDTWANFRGKIRATVDKI